MQLEERPATHTGNKRNLRTAVAVCVFDAEPKEMWCNRIWIMNKWTNFLSAADSVWVSHSSLPVQPNTLICGLPLGKKCPGNASNFVIRRFEFMLLLQSRKTPHWAQSTRVLIPQDPGFCLCLVRRCSDIFLAHANQVIMSFMSTSFMPANASLHVPIWGSANVPHKSEAILQFSFWSPFLVNLLRYA